jgi:hypothetical protein
MRPLPSACSSQREALSAQLAKKVGHELFQPPEQGKLAFVARQSPLPRPY